MMVGPIQCSNQLPARYTQILCTNQLPARYTQILCTNQLPARYTQIFYLIKSHYLDTEQRGHLLSTARK
jgi:hypothetical protein